MSFIAAAAITAGMAAIQGINAKYQADSLRGNAEVNAKRANWQKQKERKYDPFWGARSHRMDVQPEATISPAAAGQAGVISGMEQGMKGVDWYNRLEAADTKSQNASAGGGGGPATPAPATALPATGAGLVSPQSPAPTKSYEKVGGEEQVMNQPGQQTVQHQLAQILATRNQDPTPRQRRDEFLQKDMYTA